ncbi:MAG: hypothetical protein ACLQM8_03510, partial [Limisphaerales bacterium]
FNLLVERIRQFHVGSFHSGNLPLQSGLGQERRAGWFSPHLFPLHLNRKSSTLVLLQRRRKLCLVFWTTPGCEWLLLSVADFFGTPIGGKTRVRMPAQSAAEYARKLLKVNGLERWPSG